MPGKSGTPITVVGSNMVDLITYMERMPKKGETIFGKDFELGFGGKGANQAIAASRLGGKVTMVTKVGDDMFGPETINNFRENGINTEHIKKIKGVSSGVAPIFVDDEGHNRIFIVPGANYEVGKKDVRNALKEIESAKFLLMQLEIPKETVYYAIDKADEVNTPVILNPAPAAKLSKKYLKKIYLLVPNETELETITGSVVNSPEDAEKQAKKLVNKGVNNVIATLGAEGALLVNKNESKMIEVPDIRPVDTTGAGDAFVGSLAIFLEEFGSLEGAIAKANKYAAMSTLERGTQKSFKSDKEFDDQASDILQTQ